MRRRLAGFSALLAAVASGPAPRRSVWARQHRPTLDVAAAIRRRLARGVAPATCAREFDLSDGMLVTLALGVRRVAPASLTLGRPGVRAGRAA